MKRLFCSFTTNLALSCLTVKLGQPNKSHVHTKELVEKISPPTFKKLIIKGPDPTAFYIPIKELGEISPFARPAKNSKRIGKIQKMVVSRGR